MQNIVILVLLFIGTNSFGQSIDWVFLPDDEVQNECISESDYLTSTVCFGIQYIPSVTGTVSSYTFGFIVNCIDSDLPGNILQSCVMDDQSDIFDGCASLGKFLLLTSGNNGSLDVVAGDTIILHQVCLTLSPGEEILVVEDETTGTTVSIDSIDNGGAITDDPQFSDFMADDSGFGIVPCEDSTVCSVIFGSKDNRISFALNENDNIVDGASLENSLPIQYSFDVYDEMNELCQLKGGLDDITLTLELLNTIDVYGNGLIDTLSGNGHYLKQGLNGLEAEVPLGVDSNSETSSGDVRGYSIRVDFADHLEILAHQLTVDASGLNSAGMAFESARILFYDVNGIPFGSGTYNGYYSSGADLSGQCIASDISSNPYSVSGNGVVVFDETSIVNLTDPCNPVNGSNNSGVVHVNAYLDAGLDSSAVVRGFSLTVQAEDVASPNMLDDGSNSNGEDDVAGNKMTTTSALLESSLLGYTIDGCVFASEVLSVNYTSFDATKEDEKVLLKWNTTQEINHSHFEVQWSSENFDMVTIGRVDEKITIDNENSYFFLHESPNEGINYYRLVQYDLDGTFEYSDMKSVLIRNQNSNQYKVYPNPCKDILTVELKNNYEDEVPIQIYDANGGVVSILNYQKTDKKLFIDVSSFKNGLYLLFLDNRVSRFVKL
ncbi:MAG: T9SS type A sorting domain-containing protein [Saprospiraceae bacterium]|nr:T9SS type A sorting domain-containing protein [Saprospiraceae bacterium]